MAKRKIIKIDNDKCTGCGLCVPNCAEGALQIIDGKARLISDLFCDGLGACLGHCPEAAITVEEREAEPYNERLVMEKNIIPAGRNTIRAHLLHLRDHGAMDLLQEAFAVVREHGMDPKEIVHGTPDGDACGCGDHGKKEHHSHHHGGGCPGSKVVDLKKTMHGGHHEKGRAGGDAPTGRIESELKNWPVQIHLASPYAPYFKEADIVVIADCVAYAYAETHREFIKDKVVLIGCPKLDDAAAYVDKLSEIIRAGKPKSIKVVRMEVPCCGGMIEIVKQAIKNSGEVMPFETVTISIDGRKL
ncbi:MAG TPA: 4Fe-4S binding protein [bacterium]|nr:4Fe-4S binding protein [bacterium]